MIYNKINQSAVKTWIIARTIFLLIFAITYFIGIYGFLIPIIHDSNVKYIIHILTFIIHAYFILYTFIFPIIEYKEWRYKIDEDRIELINGIIIRKKVIIPISRLQFLDVHQGPINRKYGLTTIRLNTAGGLHEIPALTNKEAEELSEKLTHIIEASDDIE